VIHFVPFPAIFWAVVGVLLEDFIYSGAPFNGRICNSRGRLLCCTGAVASEKLACV
jgi:hypothetical protein